MGEIKDHAVLSPSSAKRWLTCTPSARFEEDFPNEESVFAAEGTLAHSISEIILKKRLGLLAPEFNYESWMGVAAINALYTPEMLTYCEQYADWCLDGVLPGDPVAVETRIELEGLVPESWGTGDFMRVDVANKKLYFKDLKYGKGVSVSAIENEQLMIYALGALVWWGFVYEIETVEMAIYQPRLNNISVWEISVTDLLKWRDAVLIPTAKIAFAGEGIHVVGDHCKFCRARVRCEALANHNLSLFKHELREMDKLTDLDIVDILSKVPILVSWAQDIAEYALAEAVKGKKWNGFKLVEGKSNRVFVSEAETEKKLLAAGHTEIYTPKKLLGITDLTKSLGAKTFKEMVEPDLRKPPGKPTLVPESDPRKDFDHAVTVFKDAEVRMALANGSEE